MTASEALDECKKRLSDAGVSDAAIDAWWLLEDVSKMTKVRLLTDNPLLCEDTLADFFSKTERRCKREPLAYILGSTQFMGLPFIINSRVLIPRQETEVLTESVLTYLRRRKITTKVLDLCTGSGCIAISVAKLAPNSDVSASDISQDALLLASQNAIYNSVVIDFIRSDMFEDIAGTYDVIVSNPPYIPDLLAKELQPEVRLYEPAQALFAGADGLDYYTQIAIQARGHLAPDGRLFLEIGNDQAQQVEAIFLYYGYNEVTVMQDYAGLDRVMEMKGLGG